MIEVSGTAKLRVNYSIELDMTEEDWDGLDEREQNQLIEDNVDWMDVCRSADVDDIDVDDVKIIDQEV